MSKRGVSSGLMEMLSSSTNRGGTSNVYDMSVGWTMMCELSTSASFSTWLSSCQRECR